MHNDHDYPMEIRKVLHIILLGSVLLLTSKIVFAQTCDTLYSSEKYIERSVEIKYRTCNFLDLDSVYRIVQWANIDTNYQELYPYFSNNYCYKLIHSGSERLIAERWKATDTIYYNEYYLSGKQKVIAKEVHTSEPYHSFLSRLEFYESGQLKRDFKLQNQTFTHIINYYPNGAVQSKGNYYGVASPGAWGDYVEYFPNGQVSSIRSYSEPNTADSLAGQYQYYELLSEVYYNQNGSQVDEDLNELKSTFIKIYPPFQNEVLIIDDTLYTHSQFEDQLAYRNDMFSLKEEILDKAKFPVKCQCTAGIISISLVITKDGEIELIGIDFPDGEIKKRIKKSLEKIKSWPAAMYKGNNVDTYVSTYLILNL
ncbi:MAG: hypothetical protein QNK23_08470 [Crocinitomicaceae bacterium]|nr:hypothetical protein [Crocinitomicaceae bacterium]